MRKLWNWLVFSYWACWYFNGVWHIALHFLAFLGRKLRTRFSFGKRSGKYLEEYLQYCFLRAKFRTRESRCERRGKNLLRSPHFLLLDFASGIPLFSVRHFSFDAGLFCWKAKQILFEELLPFNYDSSSLYLSLRYYANRLRIGMRERARIRSTHTSRLKEYSHQCSTGNNS